MEAAGGRDEDASDENEETRSAIPVRQVHGRHVSLIRGFVKISNRPDHCAKIAVQKSIQVSLLTMVTLLLLLKLH